MEKLIYFPEGPKNSTLPIAMGGTGSKSLEEAVDKLGIVTYAAGNNPGGAVLLNENAVIPKESFPPGTVSTDSPLLKGEFECYITGSVQLKVTNYDNFTDYVITAHGGTVKMEGDIITFTADTTPMIGNIIVNDYPFVITIKKPGIQKPAVLFPTNNATDTSLALIIQLTGFLTVGLEDVHQSTDWQIATDAEFVNLVANVAEDTVNLTTFQTSRLNATTTYYVRSRYHGQTLGVTDWSATSVFKTGTGILAGSEITKMLSIDPQADNQYGISVSMSGLGDKLIVGSGNDDLKGIDDSGLVEVYGKSGNTFLQKALIRAFGPLTSMSLDIPQGGLIRVLADDPDGFDASYTSDATVNIPSGAESIFIIGKGSSGIKGTDVPAMDQNLTGSGSLIIEKGVTKITISGYGGPGTTTYNPGQAYIAPTYQQIPSTRSLVFERHGYSSSDAALSAVNQALSTWPGTILSSGSPSSFQSQDGTWSATLSAVERTYINGDMISPGQPYIAPSYTYTTGASTTVVINGQSYDFSGSYGNVDATLITKTITVPGSSALTMTYNVPSGGSLNVKHPQVTGNIIPTSVSIAGNSTITIPTGVKQIEVLGRGAPGTIQTVPLYWKKTGSGWEQYQGDEYSYTEKTPSQAPTDLGNTAKTTYGASLAPVNGDIVNFTIWTVSNKIETTGASATFTINGVTKNFAGGVGQAASLVSQLFTLPGTASIQGTYSVPTGGEATVSYLEITGLEPPSSVDLDISANTGSITIPTGVKILTLTGKGGTNDTTWVPSVPATTEEWDNGSVAPYITMTNGGYSGAPHYTNNGFDISNLQRLCATLNDIPKYAPTYQPNASAPVGTIQYIYVKYSVGSNNYYMDYLVKYTITKTKMATAAVPGYVKQGTNHDTTATIDGKSYTFPQGTYDFVYSGSEITGLKYYSPVKTTKTITLDGLSAKTLTYKSTYGTLSTNYSLTYASESATVSVNNELLTFAGGLSDLALSSTYTLRLTKGSVFGFSSAMSKNGAYMVTGAPKQKIGANVEQGAVFISKYIDGIWQNEQLIKAADGTAGDSFGWSVDMSADGSYVIVGAPFSDGSVSNLGSAYLYMRTGEEWNQVWKATPTTGESNEVFGYSVAIANSSAVIAVGATGNDTSGADSGAVYAYVWTESGYVSSKLKASDASPGDNFGQSIKISDDGNFIYIGAPSKNSSSGAVYIFAKNGTSWTQQAKLTPDDMSTGKYFGSDIDIDELGYVLVIGARGDGVSVPGSVYVFFKENSTWSQKKKIAPSDSSQGDGFGTSVSLSSAGDLLAVGASMNDALATNAGAVYIFK